jgi:hypothetical protein
MMRAILIDPFTQTIEEVDYSGDYKDIYGLIQCELFSTVYCLEDTLFVDDEGLYVKDQRYFKVAGYPQPLAGRGLLLGTNEEGDSVDAKAKLSVIEKVIEWCPEGMSVEPQFGVMGLGSNDMDDNELTDKEIVDILLGIERTLH